MLSQFVRFTAASGDQSNYSTLKTLYVVTQVTAMSSKLLFSHAKANLSYSADQN